MPISYVTAASLDGTQNGSAPIYGARAWVNFNGTGTVAIRASGNVTSITDGGVGVYTVNFTTNMVDANYSASCTCGGGGWVARVSGTPSASAFTLNTIVGNTTADSDTPYIYVCFFR